MDKVNVKIFSKLIVSKLENEINEWLRDEYIRASDIVTIKQSECGYEEGGQVTVSVWYKSHIFIADSTTDSGATSEQN